MVGDVNTLRKRKSEFASRGCYQMRHARRSVIHSDLTNTRSGLLFDLLFKVLHVARGGRMGVLGAVQPGPVLRSK